MKVKKILNEEIKRRDAELLEEGQDLYQSLVSQYCVPESKPSRKSNFFKSRLFIILSVSLVIVFIAAAVWIFYPSEEIQYFAGDEARVDITMEDFIKGTKNVISFNQNEYSIENVVKVYDDQTNDTLGYDISFQQSNGFVGGNFFIVVNKNYKYAEKFVGDRNKIDWSGLEIEYSESTKTVNGIPISDFFGKFVVKSYLVYFSYQDITGFSTPDTILNNLLQIN